MSYLAGEGKTVCRDRRRGRAHSGHSFPECQTGAERGKQHDEDRDGRIRQGSIQRPDNNDNIKVFTSRGE